jgi:hypothetical protein
MGICQSSATSGCSANQVVNVLTQAEWTATAATVLTLLGSVAAFIWQTGRFTQQFESHQDADNKAFQTLGETIARDRNELRGYLSDIKSDLNDRLDATSREIGELRGHILNGRDN